MPGPWGEPGKNITLLGGSAALTPTFPALKLSKGIKTSWQCSSNPKLIIYHILVDSPPGHKEKHVPLIRRSLS